MAGKATFVAPSVRFVSARIAAGERRGVVRLVGGEVARLVSAGGGCAGGVVAAAGA